MLETRNLTVFIDGSEILDDINIKVGKGEVVAVMGPNGSGKSTLAKTIMGGNGLEVEGDVLFKGKSLTGVPANERFDKGIFMSFQNPPEIEGVNSEYFLTTILKETEWPRIESVSRKLDMKSELLSKDLNLKFSGGEKKKMEMLQATLSKPELVVLDEIDSGLDIDSLRVVENFMKDLKSKGKGLLVITHYTRIFEGIRPDKVYVLVGGKIVGEGGPEMLSKLDEFGFKEWK